MTLDVLTNWPIHRNFATITELSNASSMVCVMMRDQNCSQAAVGICQKTFYRSRIAWINNHDVAIGIFDGPDIVIPECWDWADSQAAISMTNHFLLEITQLG